MSGCHGMCSTMTLLPLTSTGTGYCNMNIDSVKNCSSLSLLLVPGPQIMSFDFWYLILHGKVSLYTWCMEWHSLFFTGQSKEFVGFHGKLWLLSQQMLRAWSSGGGRSKSLGMKNIPELAQQMMWRHSSPCAQVSGEHFHLEAVQIHVAKDGQVGIFQFILVCTHLPPSLMHYYHLQASVNRKLFNLLFHVSNSGFGETKLWSVAGNLLSYSSNKIILHLDVWLHCSWSVIVSPNLKFESWNNR